MALSSKTQSEFLVGLIATQSHVAVYLKSGIKLTGRMISENGDVIFLADPISQMVYKSQISTICLLEKN